MQKVLSLLPLAVQNIFNPLPTYPTTDISTIMKFPSNPDWKPIFTQAVSQQPVTFFQLATVSEPLVPKCRTLTFAGFLGEAPYSPDSTIPATSRNPTDITSAVILAASDARSKKISHDLNISTKAEGVFFLPALWTQFRVRGNYYPISPGAQHGELESRGRKAAELHMGIPEGETFDWDKELLKIWEKQNPTTIKAKFPPPTEEEPVPRDFRLIILVPDEIEQLGAGDGTLLTWKL
ncbi:hypothetical protein EX30DRAFT_187893 [Ascodesmis nigricans]|uniref:Pyridoxamine 5'-phosphate oxidase Alr4036 family FMN-binding domain-containing protein n=1 Tax=Ascodesmis nigricans TaxID=341454 RepID=A0A4S2N0N7_9PEZI|nr:hypothetical protein EX30DRAFT_187893 [Ascodesmis nigricans]